MITEQRIDLPSPKPGAPASWLQCRMAGPDDAPLLVFLHGFPEAAFAWDELLAHFGTRYRCVAPNLRGYPGSYAPAEVSAYRAHHIIQDVASLIEVLGAPAAAVVAHDWGGAMGWGLAIQRPQLLQRLVMLNSAHPGTFLRALKTDPAQQAASSYMNFLRRPDAGPLLAENDYARLWEFFTRFGGAAWLTDERRARYRAAWDAGLEGPLNYYRASPMYPATPEDDTVMKLELPDAALRVNVPTTVIWGEADTALLPVLLEGLDSYVPDLRVTRLPGASHWLVHEQPAEVAGAIEAALAR